MRRSRITSPPEGYAGNSWVSRSYQPSDLILERVEFCEDSLERIEGLLIEILSALRDRP